MLYSVDPARLGRVQVCILGGGPAAMLLSYFLSERGLQPLVIAEIGLGCLRPCVINGARITPLPIFAVLNSSLAHRLRLRELADTAPIVRYLHPNEAKWLALPTVGPDSFVAFARAHGSETAGALSVKQFGPVVTEAPLDELRGKVSRTYLSNSRPERMGHLEGVGAYALRLAELPPVRGIVSTVRSIDPVSRVLCLAAGRVRYETLVSTVPLPTLLAALGWGNGLQFHHSGARNWVFRCTHPLQSNVLVYDHDPDSPVFRAFTVTREIVTVQLARESWHVPPGAVAAALGRLLDTSDAPTLEATVHLDMCYPLDCTPKASKERIIDDLRGLGVFPFGRLGQWEYRDLHELDWRRTEHDVADHGCAGP